MWPIYLHMQSDNSTEQADIAYSFAKLSAGGTTILLGMQENQPTEPVLVKHLGNREEDTSEVLGQIGEYFNLFHYCGGFLPAPSGVYRRPNETD
jgi:hypothetical protein